MSSLRKAISEIWAIDEFADSDRWMNRIHPLVKLLVTVFYIVCVVSFGKYELTGLAGMSVYLIFVYGFGEIPFAEAMYRIRIILPIVCVVGIFNPLIDRSYVMSIGGFTVTGGMISMLTLMLKGIFSVLAAYALVVTTGIVRICYALRLLKVPKILVTQILLMYRYITLLLTEADRIIHAYMLRAPGQRGIHYKAWGPLAGQLLLRSIDRAERVYNSMCLRGFDGEFYYGKGETAGKGSYIYLIVWTVLIILFRIFPVFRLAGSLAA